MFPHVQNIFIIQCLEQLFCRCLYGWYCNTIAKLFIRRSISNDYLKIVRIALQTSPFTWCHFAPTHFIDLSFNSCCRRQIFLAKINDKIAFSSHSTYNNGVCDAIIGYNVISEPVTFCFMTCFVPFQSFNICSRKIVFRRYRVLFTNIYPFLCNLFLFRVRKILFLYTQIFSKSNYIDSFTMLWHPEIHRIDKLWVWYYITNLVKGVKNSLKGSSLIMYHKSLDIFKKECLGLVSAKYFCHIEKQCTTSFLKP